MINDLLGEAEDFEPLTLPYLQEIVVVHIAANLESTEPFPRRHDSCNARLDKVEHTETGSADAQLSEHVAAVDRELLERWKRRREGKTLVFRADYLELAQTTDVDPYLRPHWLLAAFPISVERARYRQRFRIFASSLSLKGGQRLTETQ